MIELDLSLAMAEAPCSNRNNMELFFYIYGTDYFGGYPMVKNFTELVGTDSRICLFVVVFWGFFAHAG